MADARPRVNYSLTKLGIAPRSVELCEASAAVNDVKRPSRFEQLRDHFDVHPNQITQWKAQLQEGAAGVFGSAAGTGANTPAIDVKSLHAKIGELTLENDFLEVALGKAGLLSARR